MNNLRKWLVTGFDIVLTTCIVISYIVSVAFGVVLLIDQVFNTEIMDNLANHSWSMPVAVSLSIIALIGITGLLSVVAIDKFSKKPIHT